MPFHLERLIDAGTTERCSVGGNSIHEAIGNAHDLVEVRGVTRAQIFSDPDNKVMGGSGILEAVYSDATGWVEMGEDPRGFWSNLSAETQELLDQDPGMVLNEEQRREVNRAGASVGTFFWEKDGEAGEDVYRLPGNFQAFIHSKFE